MLIGAFLPILVLASLVTEKPVGELFGKNICWIFSFLASCCVTKIGVSGFFLAIYRIICLKGPQQGIKKLRKISNELIVLEWITMFLIQGIHTSGIGFTGTDMSLAFCRYLLTIYQITYYITFNNFLATSASNSSLLEWKIALFHKKLFLVDQLLLLSDRYCQFLTFKVNFLCQK